MIQKTQKRKSFRFPNQNGPLSLWSHNLQTQQSTETICSSTVLALHFNRPVRWSLFLFSKRETGKEFSGFPCLVPAPSEWFPPVYTFPIAKYCSMSRFFLYFSFLQLSGVSHLPLPLFSPPVDFPPPCINSPRFLPPAPLTLTKARPKFIFLQIDWRSQI